MAHHLHAASKCLCPLAALSALQAKYTSDRSQVHKRQKHRHTSPYHPPQKTLTLGCARETHLYAIMRKWHVQTSHSCSRQFTHLYAMVRKRHVGGIHHVLQERVPPAQNNGQRPVRKQVTILLCMNDSGCAALGYL